jgi:hypothetical protein
MPVRHGRTLTRHPSVGIQDVYGTRSTSAIHKCIRNQVKITANKGYWSYLDKQEDSVPVGHGHHLPIARAIVIAFRVCQRIRHRSFSTTPLLMLTK